MSAAVDAATAVATPTPTRGQRFGEVVRALLRSRTFLAGAAILGFWILDALLWRAIVPHDPSASAQTSSPQRV